ncbi:MAG: hypothetical protein QOG73_4790, partial [Acetobacteraceae bacterium]|nr:hypothetical protein [Acetobacteraceae bacterium]
DQALFDGFGPKLFSDGASDVTVFRNL